MSVDEIKKRASKESFRLQLIHQRKFLLALAKLNLPKVNTLFKEWQVYVYDDIEKKWYPTKPRQLDEQEN